MWLLDRFTNTVQSGLQKTINEGFGPVSSISNAIGSTIGAVTGGVNESKKLAEQQALIDAKIESDKRTAEAKKAEKEEIKDASGVDIELDTSGNIIVKTDDQVSLIMFIVKYILIIVFSLFFAMLITNQLIFLPRVSRLIVFILILVLPYLFSSLILIPIGIYFIGLILWRIYLRATPEYEGIKISLLPKIYCMLPLTTVEGTTSFTRFFKYPFYFPQSDISERRLKKEQGQYENDLKANFYKWEEIVNKYPEFNTMFNKLSEQFTNMITPVHAPFTENNEKTTKITEESTL